MATESFFSNASLAYLASAGAGKDGKTYSIKPTDGSGDFTFSRGSNLAATRVGPTGLIEKGRENLFTYSNEFDTTWVKSNASVTSGHAGYDGSTDAWKLIQNTTNTFHFIYENVSVSSICTLSIYAKAAEYSGISFFFPNVGGTTTATAFNLSTGTFVNNTHNATAESVGNGWYRISLLSKPSGSQNFNIYVNQTTQQSEAGDGTSGIYIQDAQLEIGLAATEVITSGATTGKAGLLEDEPRFDYSGGATCPSLLLEPSRTNLFLISEPASADGTSPSSPSSYLGSLDWGIGNVYGGVQLDGGATTYHYGATVAVSTTYAISFFIRRTDSGVPIWATSSTSAAGDFMMYIGGAGVGIGDLDATPSITLFKNDVYKVEAIYTTPASVSSPVNTGILKTSANSANSVQATGFQFEVGTYPTSYIPNHSGGSVTRGLDLATILNQSGIIGQTEGTIFFDAYFDDKDRINFSLSDSTSSNYISIETTGLNSVYASIQQGGAAQASIFTSTSFFTEGDRLKCAVAYKTNDFAFYINGTQIGTDTSGLVPACDDIKFSRYNGTATANQKINQVLLFDTRLSNTDCITLTT